MHVLQSLVYFLPYFKYFIIYCIVYSNYLMCFMWHYLYLRKCCMHVFESLFHIHSSPDFNVSAAVFSPSSSTQTPRSRVSSTVLSGSKLVYYSWWFEKVCPSCLLLNIMLTILCPYRAFKSIQNCVYGERTPVNISVILKYALNVSCYHF